MSKDDALPGDPGPLVTKRTVTEYAWMIHGAVTVAEFDRVHNLALNHRNRNRGDDANWFASRLMVAASNGAIKIFYEVDT